MTLTNYSNTMLLILNNEDKLEMHDPKKFVSQEVEDRGLEQGYFFLVLQVKWV